MELVKVTARWPNMFIFPKELRDAIPEYGARALVFDEVSGAPDRRPFSMAGLPAGLGFETGPRARVQFVVHETGRLTGKYPLFLDLDSETLRSLGQFFVNLADQAEAREG
jgi:hypothetical protein